MAMPALLEKEAIVRVRPLKSIQRLQRILRLIEQPLIQRRQVQRAPLRRRSSQHRASRRQRLNVPPRSSEFLDAAQFVSESIGLRLAVMKQSHRSFAIASSDRNGPLLCMLR